MHTRTQTRSLRRSTTRVLLPILLAGAVSAQSSATSEHHTPVELSAIKSTIEQSSVSGFGGVARQNIYYCSSDSLTGKDIFATSRSRKTGAFSSPRSVGKINTKADEMMPHISRSGLELFFVRQSKGGSEIRVASRRNLSVGWHPDLSVGTTINAAKTLVTDPALTADGLTLYFTRVLTGTSGSAAVVCTSRRSAIGKPFGKVAVADAVRCITYPCFSAVPMDNGQRLWFRTLDTQGAISWRQSHLDTSTGKWTTCSVIGEVAGVSQLCFDELSGEMLEVHQNSAGKSRLHSRHKRAPSLTLRGEAADGLTAISMPTLQRSLYVPVFEIGLGGSFFPTTSASSSAETKTLFVLSTLLSGPPVVLPGITNSLILNLSLGFTSFNSNIYNHHDGLLFAAGMTVPNTKALIGLAAHFQGVSIDPKTGAGTFTGAATLRIVK